MRTNHKYASIVHSAAVTTDPQFTGRGFITAIAEKFADMFRTNKSGAVSLASIWVDTT